MDDSTDPDVRAVVNPERADAVEQLTDEADVELIEPGTAGDVTQAVAEAGSDGADIVAAVGGDGTQRMVAEAVAGSDTDLAVVPAGRRNGLRRRCTDRACPQVARLRNRRPRPGDAVIAQGAAISVHWMGSVAVQCDGDAIDDVAEISYTVEPGAVGVRVPEA